MISVTLPNPKFVANGLIKTAYWGISPLMRGKPMEYIRNDTSLTPLNDWEGWTGRPTLTSLGLKQTDAEEYLTLSEVLMTVTQEKNIVTTALQGRSGTIKEYVSDGDFQIAVQAAIIAGNGYEDRYPVDELKTFIALLKLQESVEVQSDFLDLFDIHSVVITSYAFGQETWQNRQTFSMNLLSDTPYEIKLKEDKE